MLSVCEGRKDGPHGTPDDLGGRLTAMSGPAATIAFGSDLEGSHKGHENFHEAGKRYELSGGSGAPPIDISALPNGDNDGVSRAIAGPRSRGRRDPGDRNGNRGASASVPLSAVVYGSLNSVLSVLAPLVIFDPSVYPGLKPRDPKM